MRGVDNLAGCDHTVPAEAVDAFMLAAYVKANDFDLMGRIKELDEQMAILEQRMVKVKQKKDNLNSKCRRSSRGNHSSNWSSHEKSNSRMESTAAKYRQMQEQLFALQHEYAAMQAIRMNLPLNYVMNSRAYQKDGCFHFLLGFFDEEIGRNHHGHFVFLEDGRCSYARFPFEPHGRGNHFNPPISMLDVLMTKC